MATRTSQASGGFRADDADTWGLGSGVYPATTDDIIIAAGHNITLKENNEVAYFQQLGGSGTESTLTLASHTLTINSRNSSNSRVIDVGNSYCNIAANTGKIKLTGSADAAHKLMGLNHWADELHDVEVLTSGSNPQYRQEGAVTINGDLTITAGSWTTNSSNHALTITGLLDVDGGNLNINDSVVSCAKLIVESGDTITADNDDDGNALTVTGAGIGNNRSIDLTGTISGTLDIISTHTGTREDDLSANGGGIINHLTVNHASAVMRMNATATVGNLTITAGTFTTADAGGSSKDLTVNGTVTGAGTLTGNASTISMGNFAMSGTYNATTGSTIITDRAGAGYQLSCAVADIVHNDGTFDFRGSSGGASDIRLNGASDGTNGFHDVIINASGRTVSINSYALTIDGDLTLTAGTFSTSGSNYALTVKRKY